MPLVLLKKLLFNWIATVNLDCVRRAPLEYTFKLSSFTPSCGKNKVEFIKWYHGQLKDLLISWNKLRSFAETGIIAPNLESLNIVDCYYLMDYTTLKLSWKLQSFTIINSPYPIGLFDETSFPHLVDFRIRK